MENEKKKYKTVQKCSGNETHLPNKKKCYTCSARSGQLKMSQNVSAVICDSPSSAYWDLWHTRTGKICLPFLPPVFCSLNKMWSIYCHIHLAIAKESSSFVCHCPCLDVIKLLFMIMIVTLFATHVVGKLFCRKSSPMIRVDSTNSPIQSCWLQLTNQRASFWKINKFTEEQYNFFSRLKFLKQQPTLNTGGPKYWISQTWTTGFFFGPFSLKSHIASIHFSDTDNISNCNLDYLIRHYNIEVRKFVIFPWIFVHTFHRATNWDYLFSQPIHMNSRLSTVSSFMQKTRQFIYLNVPCWRC